MKANTGTGKKHGNSHNDRYWNRLKRQFKACAYDHTGAYSELRQRTKSAEMMKLQRHLEQAEQIMTTGRYQKLKERVSFHINTDRLQAVLKLKMPA